MGDPLLIIGGEKDRTVPLVLTRSQFKHQEKNPGVALEAATDGMNVAPPHRWTSPIGWSHLGVAPGGRGTSNAFSRKDTSE